MSRRPKQAVGKDIKSYNEVSQVHYGKVLVMSRRPKQAVGKDIKGSTVAQCRVLGSRRKGRGFEPHRRHCIVSLRKTHIF